MEISRAWKIPWPERLYGLKTGEKQRLLSNHSRRETERDLTIKDILSMNFSFKLRIFSFWYRKRPLREVSVDIV